jgi:hypothetical protein
MVTTLLLTLIQASAVLPSQLAEDEFRLVPLVRSQPASAQAPLGGEPSPGDVVLQWNEVVLQAIRAKRTPAPQAARYLAMVHAAMYDAVNAVENTHTSYHFSKRAGPGTSPDAAAIIAAHRMLVELYPDQVERFDEALDEAMAAIPESPGRAAGVELGQQVAEKLLAWRNRDGARQRSTYAAKLGPGIWQPTPPGYRAALLPHWSRVTCFAMRSGSQFRPADPPALNSEEYTTAFQEVKSLGGRTSTTRTAEQTEIARFWELGEGTVTPPGQWNRIAQTLSRTHGLTLGENARLFALLNLALADAGIVAWDCKYQFNYWRPIQAIREADTTINPETQPDPTWTSLLPTPPFPSYTSGHSTFSSAGAAVLAKYFGTDEVAFRTRSDSLPGVTRSFTSFSTAAAEAGQSRIYGGIHYQFDNVEGLTSGRAVGEYVYRNFLLPLMPRVDEEVPVVRRLR